ncbi:MAG: DJ-1/PfpI family protein [Eubacteriales bacterium]|nr:DJ-1/PfpI family protein [Eubacteriales bacterium]
MKDVFLVYNSACFYEIVILSYFMKFTNCDVIFCSLDGSAVRAMEGFSVNADMALEEIDKDQVRSFIIPGGGISAIDHDEVKQYLRELNGRKVLIAGICAGVDILDKAGLLENIRSTHSTEEDFVSDGNVITARANAYVDFAIEVAKRLNLFRDETDLQETIGFWKNYNRLQ